MGSIRFAATRVSRLCLAALAMSSVVTLWPAPAAAGPLDPPAFMGCQTALNPVSDSQPGVFRPSTGTWYTQTSPAGFTFGAPGDIPCPWPDYGGGFGTNVTEFAVFRPSNGTWYVNSFAPGGIAYGQAGDVPVGGDWPGGGEFDLAVYRPSNGRWYIRNSNDAGIPFGAPGDIPMQNDWDSDGSLDPTIFRPSNGRWYWWPDNPAGTAFGQPGDVPLRFFDATPEPAVFRPATGEWFVMGVAGSIHYGGPGDIPVPGLWANPSGQLSIGVFRPSDGRWYVRGLYDSGLAYGGPGDVPLVRSGFRS